MKIVALIFFVFLCAVCSFAQEAHTYTLDPSATFVASTDLLEDVSKFYIHLKNITGNDINISWRKISVDLPAEWDYSLCDLGTCYAGIPAGDHTMFAVEKDSSGFLAPNIYPSGVTGSGKIVMYVWDKDNPQVNDTLTWFITATSEAGVQVQTQGAKELQLFPNPVTGRVNIVFGAVSTGTLSFIDVKGISQLQFGVNGTKTFDADLSQLPAGNYVALFIGRDGSVLHGKLIKN